MVSRLFTEGTKSANRERFAEALESYKTALFMAENEYLGADYRARLRFNIGVCYFRLEQYDPAVGQFKAALLLKKDYARAHYALGMAETRRREWRQAAYSFSRAVTLEPKNSEAWFDLAFASIGENDLDNAAHAFRKSIELGSIDAALSHNNIGVILAVKGELAAAEVSFENAIAMSHGRLFEAKRNLEFCRAKRQRGRELMAREQFQFAQRDRALIIG
jgi:Flp pilus assembly protein TadD